MYREDKQKLNQIFYSLINKVRFENRERVNLAIQQNSEALKTASVVNLIGVQFEREERQLQYLQEEYEEIMKGI